MVNVPCSTHFRNGHTDMSPVLPEAPASLNVYVEVPGLGRVQATGRGTSGADAARMLRESVEALRAEFAPPPLPSRAERAAALLACGTAKALAAEDYGLLDRLSKAYVLVVRGLVEDTDTPAVKAVRSLSQPGTWYEITVPGLVCTCPDYEHRHRDGDSKHLCKHSLATWMAGRLDAQEQGA